jgi:hypothetical protein
MAKKAVCCYCKKISHLKGRHRMGEMGHIKLLRRTILNL